MYHIVINYVLKIKKINFLYLCYAFLEIGFDIPSRNYER